jgi:AsmA protein
MRKWIIVASAILLVIVAAGAVAIANLNRIIGRNKDDLVKRVESAVGREIQVGEIGVTLWRGIGIRLERFAIADDPAFSQAPFVQAADLQLNLKLLPLLKREIEIGKVILHRPVIQVIRDARGRFNFATLAADRDEKEREKKKREGEREARRPPPFLVSLVDIDEGEIHYVDRGRGIDFRAARVDFEVRELSLERPVEVSLEAALFGAGRQNLRVRGRVGPVGRELDFTSLPLQAKVDLEAVPLAALEKSLPFLKERLPRGVALSGAIGTNAELSGSVGKNQLPRIKGTLSLVGVEARLPQLPQPITEVNAKIHFTGKSAEIPETAIRIGSSEVRLAANVPSFAPLDLAYRVSSKQLHLSDLRPPPPGTKKAEVLQDLKGDGSLSHRDGVLSHRAAFSSPSGTVADADYRDLNLAFSQTGPLWTIENLSLGAFGGTLKAKGRYEARQETRRFATTGAIRGMDLVQIFRSLAPQSPPNLRGQLNLDIDLTGTGKDWSSIQKAMKGQGRAEVLNGVLVGVNIAESVLGGVTGVPGLVTLVPADVRNRYPTIFNSKDTEFKQLKGSATIRDGKAFTDDLLVAAAEFQVLGKGWFGFDRTVDFRALLSLSERLSQEITSRVREARYLADGQGRVEIPFELAGKLPGARPRPDVGYVARAVQRGFVEKGLERFFPRRAPKPESAPPREPGPERPRERRPGPAEEIFRGLEGLFGR